MKKHKTLEKYKCAHLAYKLLLHYFEKCEINYDFKLCSTMLSTKTAIIINIMAVY